MKKLLLIVLALMIALAMQAQEPLSKFSWYVNIGQSIPVGDYRANSESSNPIEVGKAKNFSQSLNIGFDFYWNQRFGLTAGFSVYYYELDKTVFEKLHFGNPNYTDSYLRNNNSGKLFAGITTRFVYSRLSLEPRFTIGLTSFNFQYADFYLKDAEGNIYETINYDFETSLTASYNISLSTNYRLFTLNKLELGIQLLTELSYQNPLVKYKKTMSNSLSNSIIITNSEIHQNITSIYYGIGIILKY